jgi:hypothetical protein
VRAIHVEQARLEMLEEAFLPAAKGGCDKSALVVIRAQERRATLMGLNAPLRTDPIALAIETAPQLTSTQRLRDIFNRVRCEDPQRRMNGGPGYGDERDDEDAELIRCARGTITSMLSPEAALAFSRIGRPAWTDRRGEAGWGRGFCG